MSKHRKARADIARTLLLAVDGNKKENLEAAIQNHVADLGHLCDSENLDFTEILANALRHWAVERIDPNSTVQGPPVEIIIGTEGLPPPPKGGTPFRHMTKKSRPQR